MFFVFVVISCYLLFLLYERFSYNLQQTRKRMADRDRGKIQEKENNNNNNNRSQQLKKKIFG